MVIVKVLRGEDDLVALYGHVLGECPDGDNIATTQNRESATKSE